jgi:predicted amidohydrolase
LNLQIIYIGISLSYELHNSDKSIEFKTDLIINFIENTLISNMPHDNKNLYLIFFPEYTFSGENKSYIWHTKKNECLQKIKNSVQKLKKHKIIIIAATIPSVKEYQMNKHSHKYVDAVNFLNSEEPTPPDNRDSINLQSNYDIKIKNSLYIISSPDNVIKSEDINLNNQDKNARIIGKYSKIRPFKESLLAKNIGGKTMFQPGNILNSICDISVLNPFTYLTFIFQICADHGYRINHSIFKEIGKSCPNAITFIFSDSVTVYRSELFTNITIQMDTRTGLSIFLKTQQTLNEKYFHLELRKDLSYIRKDVKIVKV